MRWAWPRFHVDGPATPHDLALAQWWDIRRAQLDDLAAAHHAARKPAPGAGRHRREDDHR